MARPKNLFACRACGAEHPKWLGRCPDCSEWNSFDPVVVRKSARTGATPRTSAPKLLADVGGDDDPRVTCGIEELDRVLGGGMAPGSVVLVGGEPGIGKSTLLLQMCDGAARDGGQVLYVTAEESMRQVRLRADRLGIAPKGLHLLCETDLDAILHHAAELGPRMIVADSIQLLHRADIPGAPGTVTQVRECAADLARHAKETDCTVFLVGHVTKEGALAGPRTLEHLVDTVIYFEGDRYQSYRILRAVKNRFGSTDELALLEMTSDGLREVEHASEVFLSGSSGRPGAAVVPARLGSRILLVEVQGLTCRSAYGTPTRRVAGVDPNRLALILAVLERRATLGLGGEDVFVQASGGARLEEPAADLAVALAVASSFLDRPLLPSTVCLGEVGLGGEIRPVPQTTQRLREAARLGFRRALLPPSARRKSEPAPPEMELVRCALLTDALDDLA